MYQQNRAGNYQCPCCGYYTLGEPESWEICAVCFWEDDHVQLAHPDLASGANRLSLRQARLSYQQLGVSEPDMKRHVRPPHPDELPDLV